MMSEDEMAALGKATGTEFDKMWVTLMVKHHEGAVAMAETEVAEGENTEAKKLATEIIASQSEEITELKAILAKLPA